MTEPLYKSVSATIVQRIADGSYAPGSILPSEGDLGASLNVSQGTARKALSELERRGIVERRQGRGTFVTLRTPENSLFHFFRLRSADGAQVTPRLESCEVRTRRATAAEKRILHGAPDSVFDIRRMRSFAGRPLCLETCVVPKALFPGLAERTPLPNALYVLYQQAYATIIINADERLRAETLLPEDAARLDTAVGTPVLVAERQAFDLLDRIVELRKSTFLTETASYLAQLD